jgi:hypothetical protein
MTQPETKGNRRGAEIAEADAEKYIFATDENRMHTDKYF